MITTSCKKWNGISVLMAVFQYVTVEGCCLSYNVWYPVFSEVFWTVNSPT